MALRTAGPVGGIISSVSVDLFNGGVLRQFIPCSYFSLIHLSRIYRNCSHHEQDLVKAALNLSRMHVA